MSKREMTTTARKYVLGKIYIVNTLLILCHLGFALIYDYYDMNILFFTNFKNINDTYGHDAGDEVLKKLAETLENHPGFSDDGRHV